MNCVFVTQYYPPETGGGGIAAYARYIAIGLVRRGHNVSVISRLAPGSAAFTRNDGIDIYRIPAPLQSYRWRRLPIMGRHVRLLRDILYAKQVRQTLIRLSRTKMPDVVEYADIDAEGLFHPPICAYVVKLHTPHVILRRYYTADETPYARRGIEVLERRTITQADGISSPSHWLAHELSRLYGLSGGRITWVPNPIDIEFFSPSARLERQDALSILYVGRLEHRKGALVFGRAIPLIARQFPHAQFIYLGADRPGPSGGSTRTELLGYFEREGVLNQVQFHDHASPEVFREFYRCATVFVMPSLFENCPYTLLEAMSCAKPVVVSRAGGMPEMIEHGSTGLLFEADNSTALAEATTELLKSPTLRHTLGKNARQTVLERYSLEVGAAATEAFYQRILEKAGSE